MRGATVDGSVEIGWVHNLWRERPIPDPKHTVLIARRILQITGLLLGVQCWERLFLTWVPRLKHLKIKRFIWFLYGNTRLP